MKLNFTNTLLFFLQLYTHDADAFQPLSSSIMPTVQHRKTEAVPFSLRSVNDPFNSDDAIASKSSGSSTTTSKNNKNDDDQVFEDDLENQAINLQNLINKDDAEPNTDVHAGKVLGPANVLVYDTSLRGEWYRLQLHLPFPSIYIFITKT